MKWATRVIWVGLLATTGCWGIGVYTVSEVGSDGSSSTSTVGNLPTTFLQTTPADGDAAFATTPTFRWDDANDETGYILEIDDDPFFGSPLHTSPDLGPNITEYQMPSAILSAGPTYFWRVLAVNPFGQTASTPGNSMFTVHLGPWAKTIGTAEDEGGKAIYSLPGGGFQIFGERGPFGGDTGMVLDLNPDATVAGLNSFTIANSESLEIGFPTADGGAVFSGTSQEDFWTVKLAADGSVEWGNKYGDFNEDLEGSIFPTSDGGYILAGHSDSFSANIEGWVIKLQADGSDSWQKTYGGPNGGEFYSVCELTGGNFVAVGRTFTVATSSSDLWVVNLNTLGVIQWETTWGGTSFDLASVVVPTSDGGVLVGGRTDSFGGGNADFFVIKLQANGTEDWQMAYGMGGSEYGLSDVKETSDGGYIILGNTDSVGAGNFDIWIVKVDANGAVLWQKTYGGLQDEGPGGIIEQTDGTYMVAGYTESFTLNRDVWLLKLAANGDLLLPDLGADTACTVTDMAPLTTVTTPTSSQTVTTVTPAAQTILSGSAGSSNRQQQAP